MPFSDNLPPNFDAQEIPTLAPVFHHVNLKTNRLQKMIDWYETVVGGHVTFQRHDIAFITNDAANHRIALVSAQEYAEPEDRRAHIGMHHTAFEYPTLDELLLTWVRLNAGGITPAFCFNHGPTTSFYYRDPDGNHVELQTDNWDNSRQSGVFASTDPRFLEDPIGKPVDPAQLVRARQTGASPWELHVQSYAGEFAPQTPPAFG
jgi:catechol-2,3-dioxygenase